MNGISRDILNEHRLTETLEELGYLRVKQMVYRAEWSSTAVEHFLYVSTHGTPREFVTLRYGFRNPRSEAFGIGCLKAYGGDVYSVLRHDQATDCAIGFSFGKLAGWGLRWSLSLRDYPNAAFFAKLSADIRRELLPLAGEITSLDRLIVVLLQNAEAFGWRYTNGALRAAHIICVGRQLGMSADMLPACLNPYLTEIALSLKGSVTAEEYVDRVIEHAQEYDPG